MPEQTTQESASPELAGPAVPETVGASAALPHGVPADDDLPRTATTPEQRRRAFVILLLSLICVGMGGTIMFSVLPQISRDVLHFSDFQTSFLFVLSGSSWVIAAPFWGRWSDTWGRRPVILIGLLAFGFSSTLFPLAIDLFQWHLVSGNVTYGLMIAARVVFGLIGPGAMVAAQAYIVDRTTRAQRTSAIATLGASFGIGQVLGPGIGGTLAVIDLVAPFYALAVLAFASALVIWFMLPERTPPRSHANAQVTKIMKPWDRRILPFVAFAIVIGTVQAIPTQTIGFFVSDILSLRDKAAVQLVSVALMASGLAALFSQLVMVQRFRLSAAALIRWGLVVAAGSGVLLAFAHQYAPLVTALVLSGLGFGMVRPGLSAASSLAVGRDEQGSVAGVMGGMGSLGFVLCPLFAMPLYSITPQLPYALSAVCLGILVALNAILPAFRRDLHHPPAEDQAEPVNIERGA